MPTELAQQMLSLEGGTYKPGSGQILEWTYYDRFTLAAATQKFKMFQEAINQGNKTLADTNMIRGGAIPQAQHFVIHNIFCSLYPNANEAVGDWPDITNFLQETVLEFNIANKSPQGQWTLDEIFGSALPGAFDVSTPASEIIARSPFSGHKPLNEPIVLAAQTTFDVTVELLTASDAALDGFKFRVNLQGELVTLQ